MTAPVGARNSFAADETASQLRVATNFPGGSGEVQVHGRIRIGEWFGGNAEERIKRLEANPPIQQSGNQIRIGHIDDPELRHSCQIADFE